MHILKRRGWEIPESAATPEHVYLSRRTLLGAGMIGAAAGLVGPAQAQAQGDPSAALYPAPRNPRYVLDRPVTPEASASTVNNYYEFGGNYDVGRAAAKLKTRPWVITIDGLVETPRQVGIDDLLKAVTLEERLYRHRCVEAWSMAVPWTGFPMKALVDYAKPLGSAKYLRFETFLDRSVAPGQSGRFYPWPYVEGVTMAEATNDLAFMVTGIYGKPAQNQFGAPLRVALPWKYGFKSIKAIVKVSFLETRPKGFWEVVQGSEYGFWANVNPQVSHPRWSQATEKDIATGERRPTLLYNGYGEYVAGLYAGMEKERLFL
ncbi:protein-methionine-sulfoxide reductase catalytic subunit MsrP [Aquabacter spiritensis]|uniref:Protein-methionine-sulfoxide reductase catalytic subunit MsrP n=1 Tax=Aquabacter spiritensis TaxID=933073 RepID=A0A4R3LRN4_9HYPH|nr:protein-methionine-sulfoxide reductase catalytic subunit MsrP [Aquabacter spiritensis]TCT03183.1 sulfoxide reductase catalytic subunit YedY [Aquabacter spiritensis]